MNKVFFEKFALGGVPAADDSGSSNIKIEIKVKS